MDAADSHLHNVLLRHVEEVRKRLSEANIGSTFTVEIKLTGRLNSSDGLKVSYKVSDDVWGLGPEGNALTPVVTECLRRKGWDKLYAPTALPAPVEEPVIEPPPIRPPDSDDIPF